MMMFLWAVAGLSAALAVASWRRARRATRRAEELSQMYWELKYEQQELRLRLDRLTGVAAAPPEPESIQSRPSQGFVPLASLKR